MPFLILSLKTCKREKLLKIITIVKILKPRTDQNENCSLLNLCFPRDMKSFQSLGFSITMYDLGGYLLLIIKIFVKVLCSEHETKCLIYLKWLIF